MKPIRTCAISLLIIGCPMLGGCVASMAASAVGAAVQASRPPETQEDLRSAATAHCRTRAASLGEVHIIDAAQRPGGRVTVWGTVSQSGSRQAFECAWRGEVRDFDLRTLPPRSSPPGSN